eukprot:403331381
MKTSLFNSSTPLLMLTTCSMLMSQAFGCWIYYSYSYSSSQLCDGQYCQGDWQCDSGDCHNNYCKSVLPPYAIFLITFFSVFIFCTILRVICRACAAKRANVVVVRNADPHHSRSSSHSHDHHHHGAHQQLIITQTTQAPVGQPLVGTATQQPYQYGQPMPGYGMPGQPMPNQGYGMPVYGQQQPGFNQNNMYQAPNMQQYQQPGMQMPPPTTHM